MNLTKRTAVRAPRHFVPRCTIFIHGVPPSEMKPAKAVRPFVGDSFSFAVFW